MYLAVFRFHGIKGQVYAVDSRTIFIKGFEYDGQGPDAYFYAGSGADYASGFLVPNEKVWPKKCIFLLKIVDLASRQIPIPALWA